MNIKVHLAHSYANDKNTYRLGRVNDKICNII